jgi:hypothetical protein
MRLRIVSFSWSAPAPRCAAGTAVGGPNRDVWLPLTCTSAGKEGYKRQNPGRLLRGAVLARPQAWHSALRCEARQCNTLRNMSSGGVQLFCDEGGIISTFSAACGPEPYKPRFHVRYASAPASACTPRLWHSLRCGLQPAVGHYETVTAKIARK